MARQRRPGTSEESRAKRILYPDRNRGLLNVALVAAATVLAGSLALYVGGQRAVLSPGSVSAHHARVELKCAQCHTTGSNVESLRCERCHDPVSTDRMLHTAHVLFGSGSQRLADQAESRPCATCHVDHQGRNFSMTLVDDRECESCHQFRGLSRHPEFAVVRAKASAGVGLDLDNDRHVIEAQKARGMTCQYCHEPTQDRRAFQPMTFDRNCASCHLVNGRFEAPTDFVAPDLMVLPADVPAEARPDPGLVIRPNPRGKLQAVGLRHRDPWLLFNAGRLRRSIDREGDESERIALRAQVQYLDQLRLAPARRVIPPNELDAAIASLWDEIGQLDARLQGATNDDQALTELSAAAQTVAAALAALDGVDAAVPQRAAPAAPADDPDAAERIERRKAELSALLDAIVQRAPDSPAAKRAGDLRKRVDAIVPVSGDPDLPSLWQRLDALAVALEPVRAVPDSGVRAELGNIDGLRQLAVERASGGLARDDFEGRRRDLLLLLDGIELRGGEALRPQVESLRQRALALQSGTVGSDTTRRRRQQRQRQLDRLLVQRELAGSADFDEGPTEDITVNRDEIERALAAARLRLAELERAPRMTAPTTEDERLARANGLEALLGPCLKCHELDASRARMAPVRITQPVMARSIFNHAPHVTDTTCDNCHAGVKTSKYATDVNVPSVTECRTCHRPSQVRSTCVTCHRYHPQSALQLAVGR